MAQFTTNNGKDVLSICPGATVAIEKADNGNALVIINDIEYLLDQSYEDVVKELVPPKDEPVIQPEPEAEGETVEQSVADKQGKEVTA